MIDTSSRCELRDMTFLLPVRIDSMDRSDNVSLVVSYLFEHFCTRVIVLEADGFQHLEPEMFPAGVEYRFVKDENKKFHRTHYINQMIKSAATPYIGIWDADVVIPEKQIGEAVRLLRERECFCVLPYDGKCYNLGVREKERFGKSFRLEMPVGELYAEHACGGALIVEKRAFVEAGMCNEYLTSWGPDDVEQRKRLEILGHSIRRTPGGLYHLHHSRGTNSGYDHCEERVRLVGEYVKVASMTSDELRRYVAVWPWRQPEERQPDVWDGLSEERLAGALERWEDRVEADGLYGGTMGLALGWFRLAQGKPEAGYGERVCRLLDELTEKIRSEKVPWGLLPGIGSGLLAILRKSEDFQNCRQTLEWIDTALFGIFYLKQMDTLSIERGAAGGVSYFLDVLSFGKKFSRYDSVYYEEYLIFLTDELGRLLTQKYDSLVEGKGAGRKEWSRKELADCLLVYGRLENVAVNREATSSDREKLIRFVENHLDQDGRYVPEDIWLVFAYGETADVHPECRIRFYKCLEKWRQEKHGENCASLHSFLYRRCCRRAGVAVPEFEDEGGTDWLEWLMAQESIK